jgi:hypothetical protein
MIFNKMLSFLFLYGLKCHALIFAANFNAHAIQAYRRTTMIQQAARDFAKNECLPGVIERDEKQQFPANK